MYKYNNIFTDQGFKSKYQAAVAVFTIFFLVFLAIIVFFVWKILKGRKEYEEITQHGNELKLKIKEKQNYF